MYVRNIVLSNNISILHILREVILMKNAFTHLTYEDRLYIEECIVNKVKIRSIAEHLDVSQATIYREINKGKNEKGVYSPLYAHNNYLKMLKEKGLKPLLNINTELAKTISYFILKDNLSISKIVNKLKKENNITISKNTIYSAIDNSLIPNVTRKNLNPKTTKVFSKGLVQLPKYIREKLNINDGDIVNIKIKDNKIIIEKD